MRKATTVKPLLWKKPSFKSQSADYKLVWLLLTAGPDTNLSGLVSYSLREMAEYTSLSEARVKKVLTEMVEAKRILWDDQYHLILILRYIKHNPIRNAKLERGALYHIRAYEKHEFYEPCVYLIEGGDPDMVWDTIYGDRDNKKEKTKSKTKSKASTTTEKVVDSGWAMVKIWNRFFGKSTTPNDSVLRAVRAALNCVPDAGPDDFAAVVKMRITEDWVDPGKYGVQSLIRAKDIASHIERARERGDQSGIIRY